MQPLLTLCRISSLLLLCLCTEVGRQFLCRPSHLFPCLPYLAAYSAYCFSGSSWVSRCTSPLFLLFGRAFKSPSPSLVVLAAGVSSVFCWLLEWGRVTLSQQNFFFNFGRSSGSWSPDLSVSFSTGRGSDRSDLSTHPDRSKILTRPTHRSIRLREKTSIVEGNVFPALVLSSYVSPNDIPNTRSVIIRIRVRMWCEYEGYTIVGLGYRPVIHLVAQFSWLMSHDYERAFAIVGKLSIVTKHIVWLMHFMSHQIQISWCDD